MSPKEVYLTQEGLDKLKAELEELRTVGRAQVADRIHEAKELSDTVDNAEYDDAKNAQAFVEGRILTLEKMIRDAVIIAEEAGPSNFVKLGSRVSVLTDEGEEEHYVIVGSAEANPQGGRISNESPVGRALLGRKKGKVVQVVTPGGVLRLKIVKIG